MKKKIGKGMTEKQQQQLRIEMLEKRVAALEAYCYEYDYRKSMKKRAKIEEEDPRKERDALDLFKYILSVNGIVKELVAFIRYPSFLRNFSLALNSKCKVWKACDVCRKKEGALPPSDYVNPLVVSKFRKYGAQNYLLCYSCFLPPRICVKCGLDEDSIFHPYPPLILPKLPDKFIKCIPDKDNEEKAHAFIQPPP